MRTRCCPGAREQGVETVGLFVTETNDRARRFYERFGFRDTGEREPLESNPRLQCLRMVRTVIPAR
ncbi:GNAT family N-acetyltransferase [Microbispora sp. ATCC PTA-5024]|uniref:GNAT family N-acetyltransferase n=1 Tax=Microbispora sp. ATCC PTA-5024 TaxID=316330 RepID=UPI0012ED21F6|nr:GNAT family N-acetyltransferase [Microbispora sp. ATCC PTA-5024]